MDTIVLIRMLKGGCAFSDTAPEAGTKVRPSVMGELDQQYESKNLEKAEVLPANRKKSWLAFKSESFRQRRLCPKEHAPGGNLRGSCST